MDLKLEHDPRTKSQIKDALCDFIYDPVRRQFKSRIDTLVQRNSMLGGYSHHHFVYRGQVYNADTTAPPLRKNRLAPQLRQAMEEYLRDLEQLNSHELPYVLNFINQVLNSSSDLTDYMRVLPESVHHPLKQMIVSCPCRATHLDEDRAAQMRAKNQASIDLIKQRLVTNLLI